MKFVSILLKEGRKEDLKKKYSDKFGVEVLDFVLNNPDLQKFNHKYTDFVLRTLPKDSKTLEDDVESTIWAIQDFDKYQSQLEKKDINQYKSYIELEKALHPVRVKEKEKELEKQVDKIYEDDKFLVVKPKTEAASCKYGSNTKWCTTSKGGGHFERYTRGNQALYYIINKENSTNKDYSKVAVHIGTSGNQMFWDSKDAAMGDREVSIFKYAFPEIMDAIEKDYEIVEKSGTEKLLQDIFNDWGVSITDDKRFLGTDSTLLVSTEGFETINDLGFGHAHGTVNILLNKKIIDSYQILIFFKINEFKTLSIDIGFSGNDPSDEENFLDLGLEDKSFKFSAKLSGVPAYISQSLRTMISNKVMDIIKEEPKLQQKLIGSSRVWRPNRSSYGYTFGENKGLIKKLIDWLDSGKTGTKLNFLTDIGKIDVKTIDNKLTYSHKGKNKWLPSSQWRGHFSAFFASAKLAGIITYKKIGNQYILIKGPNFDAFKSGELKPL